MPTIKGDKIHIHQKKCSGREQNSCVPSPWHFIMSLDTWRQTLCRQAGEGLRKISDFIPVTEGGLSQMTRMQEIMGVLLLMVNGRLNFFVSH